jgi:photosystem II stability/assembly factor-like uncharacterized protein
MQRDSPAAAATVPIPSGGNVTRLLVEADASHRRVYATLYYSWLFVLAEGRLAHWKASVPSAATSPGTHSVYVGDETYSNLYLWMTEVPFPGDTIFHSTDHGASWSVVPPPDRVGPIGGFAVSHAFHPTLYYTSSIGLIYSSADDGQTWTALTAGPKRVALVFVAPSDAAVIFAYGFGADEHFNLFKSVDAGVSWSAIPGAPTPTGENSFLIEPTNSSTIHVAAEGGIYNSSDGGQSWTLSTKGFGRAFPIAGSLARDPLNSKVLLTIIDDLGYSGLFRSVDAGETWSDVGIDSTLALNCIAFDPLDDQVIYVGTAVAGVVKSTDGGKSWALDDLGLANAPVGFNFTPRKSGHTVTALRDGSVLIAGGDAFGTGPEPIPDCERFDPETNLFSRTGSMTVPRETHTATLLQDGRVVVSGGMSCCAGEVFLRSTEVYDPVSETWEPAGDMQFPRANALAALLPSGKVLVVGGEIGLPFGSGSVPELFDPSTGTLRLAAPLPVAQFPFTATMLLDSSLFLTLGNPSAGSRSAALYDYRADQWTPLVDTPSFNAASATLLTDGRVLLFDGTLGEVFDPGARTFTPTGTGPVRLLSGVQALGLNDGRAYVCCSFQMGTGEPTHTAEFYDPVKNTFEPAPETALQRGAGIATKLKDGRVLIVGGYADYIFAEPEIRGEVFEELSDLTTVRPRRGRPAVHRSSR